MYIQYSSTPHRVKSNLAGKSGTILWLRYDKHICIFIYLSMWIGRIRYSILDSDLSGWTSRYLRLGLDVLDLLLKF
jgi:hypothetical protein